MNKKKINCPICDSQNIKEISKFSTFPFIENSFHLFKYSLDLCLECNFLFNKEPLNQKSLDWVYKHISFSDRSDNENHLKNIDKQISFIKTNTYFNIENRELLEIGGGFSYFSQKMISEKWNVTEIEPSKNLINNSNEIDGYQSRNCTIEDFETSQKYDLICLRHVLEHLLEPKIILKKLKKILNNNGKIFIEVPNFEFSKPIGIETFFNFLHLYHFTANSICNILNQCGFKILELQENTGYSALRLIATPCEENLKGVEKESNIKGLLDRYYNIESKISNEIESKLKNIINQNDKIFVWGAGFHTEELLKILVKMTDVNNIFLVDSNQDKWGKSF